VGGHPGLRVAAHRVRIVGEGGIVGLIIIRFCSSYLLLNMGASSMLLMMEYVSLAFSPTSASVASAVKISVPTGSSSDTLCSGPKWVKSGIQSRWFF
jgi:hypothetical protein